MKKRNTYFLSRRRFLEHTGYLSIGFTLFGCAGEMVEDRIKQDVIFDLNKIKDPIPDASRIDAWLQILENGEVQILTGKMELGQGLTTVMQQVAGEELNILPSKIKVILADTGLTQNEGYTAGSRTAERSAMTVRRAAAAARECVLNLAGKAMDLPVDQLIVQEGCVKQKNTEKSVLFKDLLHGEQLSEVVPDDIRLKPKDQYLWVGKPVPHPDMEKMVRGEALFIQDLQLAGMVHARVVRPPVYGAKLDFWPREVQQMPGVLKVIENGSFLAVIAEEEYLAVKAVKALSKKIRWKSAAKLPEVNTWTEFLKKQNAQNDHLELGLNTHQAIYSKPYIMHGAIGPSCAIALFKAEYLQIWSHTQGVYPLRSTISHLTGMAEKAIRIIGVRGSGCYGHNGADDVSAEAALLAIALPDRPIRLQWEREDEHKWEPYGTAMCMEISAQLNSNKKIEQWSYQIWSDGHSTRPRGNAGNFVSARYLKDPFSFQRTTRVGGGTRNAKPYYDIPNTVLKDYHVKAPLRTSALRSLGAYANIFAIECFMEELADKTGQHPLVFRMNHLSDPRALEVITELQSWLKSENISLGQGIGYGFSRYKNTASYCTVAAKVFVDLPNKVVTPVKMWAVLDAGEAINPDGLKNQTAGGMIQSASWTLLEEVQFHQDEITSKDWVSYPILRFGQVPETAVMIIDRPDQPPLGAGEAAQGPAAAAVANAVYHACGRRVRDLPLEKHLFE